MRALLIVLDGAGCGAAPDAAAMGDQGANTLGHLWQAEPGLMLPALFSLGLWKAVTGEVFSPRAQGTRGRWGRMRPAAPGKDSLSGHWELAGAICREPFRVYPQVPEELMATMAREGDITFLGGGQRRGTAALAEWGEEHLRTGQPILYTSADSVLHLAAHEAVLPSPRLHELCRIARRQADAFRIGRVIARPFRGEPGAFEPKAGRRDYAMVPPRTVLNAIAERGLQVHGVGRVHELFAGSGVTRSTPAESNAAALTTIERLWAADENGLIFANLSDFDTLYGHGRDPAGFARALADFDEWLEAFLPQVEEDDLVLLTADHGNDPTFAGSDHTREEVPLLMLHGRTKGPLGTRRTFADVAATLAHYFGVRGGWSPGRSFLS